VYCCGPATMIEAFKRATASKDRATVHYEYFATPVRKATETPLTPSQASETEAPGLQAEAAGSVAEAAGSAAEAGRAGAAPSTGFTVELATSGRTFFVPAGRTVLEVLAEAGVDVAYGCKQGVCGACETRVLSGTPDHRDEVLSDEERAANATMMLCCSGSLSACLVLDL
jgi:tetrachlorobenzoquinone reductase